MIRYLKSLNWSGYFFCLLLVALAALANKSVIDFISWVIYFSVGAFICLFIIIAGRDETKQNPKK